MYFLLKIDVQVHTVKLKETVTSENQKILQIYVLLNKFDGLYRVSLKILQ